MLSSLFGGLISSSSVTTRDEMEDIVSNKVSSECRPASCSNTSTGGVEIGYVGKGCDLKLTQQCNVSSECVINSAIDAVAKQIKKSEVTGGIGSGKALIDISKKDTTTSIKKKLETAIENTCGGSAATNYSNRPLKIGICEGKVDMSQLGDAKSKCALDAMLKSTTTSEDIEKVDNATSSMMLFIFLGVAGVIGLIVFIKLMKSRGNAAATAGASPSQLMSMAQMPQFQMPQFQIPQFQMPQIQMAAPTVVASLPAVAAAAIPRP